MKFYVDIYLDHNLGDDLFLDTLLQRYPEHDFYVGIPSHVERLNIHFNRYSNLKKISPIGIKNIFNVIDFDAYILIGGSVYMDLNKSFRRLWLSRLFKSIICALSQKPFYVIGANLGPFNTKLGKLLLFIHFNVIKHISVRDKHSYDLLKRWKKFNTYSIAPDVVFSHTTKTTSTSTSTSTLGISVINTSRHIYAQEAYIKKIAALINLYLSKSSSNSILLMGFDGGLENDNAIIQRVLEDQNMDRIKVLNYSPDLDMMSFLNEFKKCDSIVCSRFHAMILAIKYNKKIFPICYSEKMSNVLLDMKHENLGINYENIDDLDVERVVDELSLVNNEDNKKLRNLEVEYMKSAVNHFNCIDSIIARKTHE